MSRGGRTLSAGEGGAPRQGDPAGPAYAYGGEQFAVPFVKALVAWRGSFLMQRRSKEGDPYRGFWELPGGKMQRGETAEAALAREVREEAGLDLVEVLGQGDDRLTDRFGRSARVLRPLITVEVASGPWPLLGHYFACRTRGEPCGTAEGDEHRWITPVQFQAEFLARGASGECTTLDLLAMSILLKEGKLEQFLKVDS